MSPPPARGTAASGRSGVKQTVFPAPADSQSFRPMVINRMLSCIKISFAHRPWHWLSVTEQTSARMLTLARRFAVCEPGW
ncbi:hypothetical protein DKX15_14570, partial [Enterococcus faecium]